jgi:hypothetical protein
VVNGRVIFFAGHDCVIFFVSQCPVMFLACNDLVILTDQ